MGSGRVVRDGIFSTAASAAPPMSGAYGYWGEGWIDHVIAPSSQKRIAIGGAALAVVLIGYLVLRKRRR